MESNRETTLARFRTVKERVFFKGHPMVRALHPTTIEITMEEHLTENGDCIIGVSASSGCAQLGEALKSALRTEGSLVTIRLLVGSEAFSVAAEGLPGLKLTDPRDIVIRKSRFLSDRTLAVGANAAAKDLPRSMVQALRDPGAVGVMEVEVTQS